MLTCPCFFLSDALRGSGWNVSLRMLGVRFQLPLRPRHFSRTSDAHASVSLSVCARAHAGVRASVSPPSSSYFVQLLQLTDPPLSPSKCWTCEAVRRSVVCTHPPTHTHKHIPTPTHIFPPPHTLAHTLECSHVRYPPPQCSTSRRSSYTSHVHVGWLLPAVGCT